MRWKYLQYYKYDVILVNFNSGCSSGVPMSGNTLTRLIRQPSPLYEELDQVATRVRMMSLQQNTVDIHEILYCEIGEHMQVRDHLVAIVT